MTEIALVKPEPLETLQFLRKYSLLSLVAFSEDDILAGKAKFETLRKYLPLIHFNDPAIKKLKEQVEIDINDLVKITYPPISPEDFSYEEYRVVTSPSAKL